MEKVKLGVKWLQSKGLKYSMILVIVLAVAALTLIFSWFQVGLSESILATNYSFLEEATDQQVITIQTKLSGQWQQLELYARIFENIDMSDYTAVKEALNVTNGFGEFKRISVANDVGYVINNDNTASGNILKTDYYQLAMEGVASISPSTTVDSDGEEVFVLSVPIYQKGNVKGALLGTFNRASLQAIVSEEVFDGNGTFYVLDSDGMIVLTGKHALVPEDIKDYFYYMKRTNLNSTRLDELKLAMQQRLSGNLEYKIGSRERVAYYQTIPMNDWVLVSVVDKDFILKQRQQINVMVAVLISAVLLVVAVIMAYAYQLMKQRAKEIQDTESLKVKAERDSLTQLYNKIALEEHVTRRLQESTSETDAAYALYILDLDNFKQVNDTWGHAFGDKVLCDLADCINRVFSVQDILGRIGGDEFIALKDLRDVPAQEREEIINRRATVVCEDFSRTYTLQNTSCKVSLSVGVALFGVHGTTFGELYRNADKALYEAKHRGKNNYVVYQKKDGGKA